jgi:MFS family permease
VLLPLAFLISCTQQFYVFHSAGFLSRIDHPWTARINAVFGVGGAGLMTIGHMAEILVLAVMPLVATRVQRKALLAAGFLAYIVRFAVFAYLPTPVAVLPALALQGLCFGCVFFVAFMIVDEETTPDIRASAQAVFNIVAFGLAVIVGNLCAALVAQSARGNYRILFGIPMWAAILCLLLLFALYPRKRAA